MKKLYRIFLTLGGIFLVLTITGGILVYVYKEDIQRYILKYLNEHLNTKVDVGRVDVTMLRHFPYISATFRNVTVLSASPYRKTNPAPDTLLSTDEVVLDINIYNALVKKNVKIERILVTKGRLRLAKGKDGKKNWEILKSRKNENGKGRSVKVRLFRMTEIRYRYEDRKTGSFAGGIIRKGEWDEGFLKRRVSRIRLEQESVFTGHKGKKNKILAENSEISFQLQKGKDTLRIGKGKIVVGEYPELSFYGSWFKGKESQLILHFSSGEFAPGEIPAMRKRNGSGQKIIDPGGKIFVEGDVRMKTAGSFAWTADLSFGGMDHVLKTGDGKETLKIPAWKGKGKMRSSGKNIRIHLTADPVKIVYKNSSFAATAVWDNQRKGSPVDIRIRGKAELKDMNVIFGGNRVFLKGTGIPEIRVTVPVKVVTGYQEGDWKKIGVTGTMQLKNFEAMLPGKLEAETARVTFLSGHQVRLSGDDIRGGGSHWKLQGTLYHLDGFIEKHAPVLIKGDLYTPEARLEDIIAFFRMPAGIPAADEEGTGKRFVPVVAAGLRADKMFYQDVELENLKGVLLYKDPVLDLKNLDFHVLEGSVWGGMTIRFLPEGELFVRTYGEMKHINIHDLFRSFHDFNQEFIRAENLKGYISGNVALQARFDSTGVVMPETILSDSYLVLEEGALLNFEPLYKLSRFIHLSELKNIRFSRLENEVFISDSRVIIPNMTVKSSAIDLDIAGTHAFDKHFEYRIRVYLSDFLARKARKSNRDNGLDLIEEPGERNTSLFLIYKGDAENSKVSYDRERTRRKISDEIKKEKETLKNILREDMGVFRKDTSVLIQEKEDGKTFRVEWPEEQQGGKKKDTGGKDTSSGKKFRVIWEEEPDSLPKKGGNYR